MSVLCHERTHALQQIGRWSADEMGVANYLWLVRGNTILNSAKSPGSVSTSMVPPCCFTMMSWLMDRPSPVPSPAAKAAPEIASVTVSADGVSVDEMVDSVQSDESGNDKVDGNDVIQQARQNQDQDACDESNDRRKMFGSEGHDDLLGG